MKYIILSYPSNKEDKDEADEECFCEKEDTVPIYDVVLFLTIFILLQINIYVLSCLSMELKFYAKALVDKGFLEIGTG